jgi:hypothetical protein
VSVESAADRAAFLADFGVPVDWTVGATTTSDILVLFDNGAVPAESLEGLGVITKRATITLPEADMPSGAGGESDVIAIGAATYRPKNPMPDGTGFMVVTLEKILS